MSTSKVEAHQVLLRIANGERLTSSPERWWDWMNPFVVRFDDDSAALPNKVCDYLFSRRMLRVRRVIGGVRELELGKRGLTEAERIKSGEVD